MDNHSHIDQIVVEIRKRMRMLWTRERILADLCIYVPGDVLFLCYASAAIMERDYGRSIP